MCWHLLNHAKTYAFSFITGKLIEPTFKFHVIIKCGTNFRVAFNYGGWWIEGNEGYPDLSTVTQPDPVSNIGSDQGLDIEVESGHRGAWGLGTEK